MTGVAVRRLRTSRTRTEAEALLRRAVAEAPDRQVLIVRRLLVAGGDPDAARYRLAELRRTAARPTPGDVRPGWSPEAVLFEDEAQLLACLTADVITGAAAQRWYWRPRLARGGVRPLVSVWMDAPRWLPAAIELLEEVRPDLARAAVRSLATTELRAVAAAVAEVGLRPPRAFGTLEPQLAAAAAAVQPAPVAVPQASGRTRPPDTRPVEQDVTAVDRHVPTSAADGAHHHVVPALHGSPTADRPGAPAAPEVRRPHGRPPSPPPAEQARPRVPTPAPSTGEPRLDTPTDPPVPPSVAAGAPVIPPAGQTPAHSAPPHVHGPPPAPPHGRPDPVPALAGEGTIRRRLPDAPLLVESQLAGVCYLLPLLVRLSDTAGPHRPTPTWTELSAFGRRVVRRHLDDRRRADPLWTVLAGLAARNHETGGAPRGSEPWWPDALDFLTRHELAPRDLTIPGRIGVTRTHVDVLFTLDQIDLRVRRAGLDQDPGWVPSLRRIVSLHYL